jgi:putative SbcD/Mre11-related phosphoesterase
MAGINIAKGLTLTEYSAAVLEKEQVGVIADLHIGMEETGMISTRVQTAEIMKKTKMLIRDYGLSTLVLNGDLKFSFGRGLRQEWDELANYIGEMKKSVRIIAIKGNHDLYLQNIMRGIEIKEIYETGGFRVTHGNLDLEPSKKLLTIIGHDHPAVKVRDELGAMHEYQAYMFMKKENVLVLPAFNPLSIGFNIVNEQRWLSPMLSKCNVQNAEIYAIAEDEVVGIGKLDKLNRMFR